MKRLALFVLPMVFCATGFADRWYVATDSANDGPGTTWSNAFHTIQAAVDAATANSDTDPLDNLQEYITNFFPFTNNPPTEFYTLEVELP